MLVAIAALAGCAAPPPAHAAAQPVVELRQDDIVVALYGEPCALEGVVNLRFRATWRDPRRGHFEGCYDIQHGQVVAMYFDDRTVITAPVRAFGLPGASAPEPEAKPEAPRPIAF